MAKTTITIEDVNPIGIGRSVQCTFKHEPPLKDGEEPSPARAFSEKIVEFVNEEIDRFAEHALNNRR